MVSVGEERLHWGPGFGGWGDSGQRTCQSICLIKRVREKRPRVCSRFQLEPFGKPGYLERICMFISQRIFIQSFHLLSSCSSTMQPSYQDKQHKHTIHFYTYMHTCTYMHIHTDTLISHILSMFLILFWTISITTLGHLQPMSTLEQQVGHTWCEQGYLLLR